MARRRPRAEIVDIGSRPAEVDAIVSRFNHLLSVGQVTGVVMLIERPGGAYELVMSGTDNPAERIGRLRMVEDDLLDRLEGP